MDLFKMFGLPAVLPAHGTDAPLDEARLSAVLASGGVRYEWDDVSGPAADRARLCWLWAFVERVEAGSDASWVEQSVAELHEGAALREAWPIPGATGPAAEATLIRSIPRSELEAIAARRDEVKEFMGHLYGAARPDPAEYVTVRDSDPEALQWLEGPGGRALLAGNRFDSPAEAAEFVRSLYAAGAKRVVIASEAIRPEQPGEWYADAIRVVLPGDPIQRAGLFDICNAEGAAEGFDPAADTGQPALYLWWD